MRKITKAILPVAGFGTRFLPATKAQPKEMLPVVDKPAIQYLVEDAVAAGIEEIIFALSPNMEGDTTAFYLFRKLADYDCKITTIARGVAIGDELEYADEVTLGRSIRNRISFSTYNTPN